MKIIENKALAYANTQIKAYGDISVVGLFVSDIVENVRQAYIAGAKEALASQWRDANKELPELGQEVLWHFRHRTPRGTWLDGYVQDAYDGEYKPENVEHWMPVPELPVNTLIKK